MTLAILIFNFYPLTAVMIVMLALLNDGAILSIAYDNVHYKDKPEVWNMRMVLGVATVLGIVGVISAFGLFYLGERVFHLDRAHIQTLMYLKLSVAGHLTIFLTRTRGPFWSIRPARVLWIAVLGTQIVATLIAVYGLFMTPLGWGWAGFVWGYALLWFLVNDRVKLLAYRIFDPVKTELKTEVKTDAKTVPNAETKAEPKPEAVAGSKSEATEQTTPDAKIETKTEVKTEAKPTMEAKPEAQEVEPKPEVKVKTKPETKADTTSGLTPQIATRAYELYEQQGRQDGQSVQNWDKAEREVREDQAKAEAKPETLAEPQTDAKAEPKPETKVKTPSDLTPQLVTRVHELYEELGREEVRAVEELEKAQRDNRKDEPDGPQK